MNLKNNKNLEIYIFNVDRGLSILCKTPQNHILIYDLGSTKDFSPIKDIYKTKDFFSKMEKYDEKYIAQTMISHPHLDHISDLTDENVSFIKDNSALITCQNDKEERPTDSSYNKTGHKINFNNVNNPKENCNQIDNYKDLYEERHLPLRTMNSDVDGLDFKFGYYYLTHKQIDEHIRSMREKKSYNDDYSESEKQDYTNSLSIVLYIYYLGSSILIPGDITPWAFEEILKGNCEKRFTNYKKNKSDITRINWTSKTCDQPKLGTLLSQGLTILVAPHHGLKSGYCQYLFDFLKEKKPEIILISEKSESANSGSVADQYQNGTCSNGIEFGDTKKKRWSLTTRKDGNIKIRIKPDAKWDISTNTSYKELFS